jgi:Trypsin
MDSFLPPRGGLNPCAEVPGRGKLRVLVGSLLGLALVLGACKERPGREKADASTQDTAPERDAEPIFESLAGDVVDPVRIPQISLDGEVDAENRYLSTVLIEASSPTDAMNTLRCSGVLMAPRLVLTAGHCVCTQHKDQGGTVIEQSDCLSTATVISMTYQRRKPGENLRALHEHYRGKIRPHPELRIQLDAQQRLTSVHADLAIILLEEPMPDRIIPLKLAESGLQPEEPLVLSGYGSNGTGSGLYGERRFNKVRVARVSEDHERIFLDQPRRPRYANDSGGPCLREVEQGGLLVGISIRGLGSEPMCMSMRFHKDWLREELLKAVKTE